MTWAAGCEPSSEEAAGPPAARPVAGAITNPVAPPTSRPEQSDGFQAALAALRHLVGEQPLAADRSTYAAYLVRGDAAPALAAALSDELKFQAAPPVVTRLDVYRRKGRTMDRATGRPVKVFRVRLVRLAPDAALADVLASWDAGRLAGGAFHYHLRKGVSGWAVVARTEALPPAQPQDAEPAPAPNDAPPS